MKRFAIALLLAGCGAPAAPPPLDPIRAEYVTLAAEHHAIARRLAEDNRSLAGARADIRRARQLGRPAARLEAVEAQWGGIVRMNEQRLLEIEGRMRELRMAELY